MYLSKLRLRDREIKNGAKVKELEQSGSDPVNYRGKSENVLHKTDHSQCFEVIVEIDFETWIFETEIMQMTRGILK
jgi:hypothetical protein